jgi:hypothetical protein
MAGILSVSRTNLAKRRQKLRRQRQLKILQAIWRTLAVTFILGGNPTDVGVKGFGANSD